ncbi:hypothetical protein M8494_02860 [Serratia ureilytica]
MDEAAAIPAPLLQQLIGYFPRVLLTTTVQGMRAPAAVFCWFAGLPSYRALSLQQPMRWAQGDALEQVTDNALLFNRAARGRRMARRSITARRAARTVRRSAAAGAFLRLLSSALPHLAAGLARADGCARHALRAGAGRARWSAPCGWWTKRLSAGIGAMCGRPPSAARATGGRWRRGGQWWAPTLLSRRITRIATLPALRRRGIARQLIEQQRRQAQGAGFPVGQLRPPRPLWRFGNPAVSSWCVSAANRRPAAAAIPRWLPGHALERTGALRHAAHKHPGADWPRLRQRIELALAILGDDGRRSAKGLA